jgi:hypothetical protein
VREATKRPPGRCRDSGLKLIGHGQWEPGHCARSVLYLAQARQRVPRAAVAPSSPLLPATLVQFSAWTVPTFGLRFPYTTPVLLATGFAHASRVHCPCREETRASGAKQQRGKPHRREAYRALGCRSTRGRCGAEPRATPASPRVPAIRASASHQVTSDM